MKKTRIPDRRTFGWISAWTIAVSAFLLFQVQPVISKTILPWFGGSPAVWTTCLLFFQVLLVAGYGYAHGLVSRVSPAWVVAVHAPLLAVAVLLLPITPDTSWKPDESVSPAGWILWLLLANVGLPYFLLASTGPLVQAWFARVYPHGSPYRLYALSNVGSLVALLSYPLVIEPTMTTQTQCAVWSIGFGLFAISSGALSVMLWKTSKQAAYSAERSKDRSLDAGGSKNVPGVPTWRTMATWVLLSALGSLMLLCVTNHLCQNVVVVPFLWIAPLSIYLITFIICFDNERWYVRRWFGLIAAMSVLAVCNAMFSPSVDRLYQEIGVEFQWMNLRSNILLEGSLFLLMLFFVTMVCHGELVRLKPVSSRLTSFYLAVATGGALGGICVALVSPLIFNSFLEFKLGLIASFLLAMMTVYCETAHSWFAGRRYLKLCALLFAIAGFFMISTVNVGTELGIPLTTQRNFYGVISIRAFLRDNTDRPGIAMYHGSTLHGYQYDTVDRARIPTTYYEPGSGVGLALTQFPRNGSLQVGVIGLGTGTVAAYAQPGDTFRFYEIDPDVIRLSQQYFTFLKESEATIEIVPGDARLALEREPPQTYDILVIDAFSGDAVPTHLLSVEAFAVYERHIKPNGLLAFHVSNRYFNLGILVQGLADRFQFQTRCVLHNPGVMNIDRPPSAWMLVSRSNRVLDDKAILEKTYHFEDDWRRIPLWTDHYSSLGPLLW